MIVSSANLSFPITAKDYCLFLLVLFTGFLVSTSICLAQSGSSGRRVVDPLTQEEPVPAIELGDEYTTYARERVSAGRVEHRSDNSTLEAVVMYFPNRVMDLYDVFRVDVGVGSAVGGVVRVTSYGQAGYRKMMPGAVRVGLRGRSSPVFVENQSEYGVSPYYYSSQDRKVTSFEVGAGVDAVIVGGYAGVSLDELVDFLAGVFLLDPKDDDWEIW